MRVTSSYPIGSHTRTVDRDTGEVIYQYTDQNGVKRIIGIKGHSPNAKHCAELFLQPSDPAKTRIIIGGTEYEVDLEKIPYLKSFASFQRLSGQATGPVLVHDNDIPFFKLIMLAMSRGFHIFTRHLPLTLLCFQELCHTLDFLRIDVMGQRSLVNLCNIREGCRVVIGPCSNAPGRIHYSQRTHKDRSHSQPIRTHEPNRISDAECARLEDPDKEGAFQLIFYMLVARHRDPKGNQSRTWRKIHGAVSKITKPSLGYPRRLSSMVSTVYAEASVSSPSAPKLTRWPQDPRRSHFEESEDEDGNVKRYDDTKRGEVWTWRMDWTLRSCRRNRF